MDEKRSTKRSTCLVSILIQPLPGRRRYDRCVPTKKGIKRGLVPDDSFNDVSELYSKIAISYIAMYNQADSTAILDESATAAFQLIEQVH